MIRSAEEFVSLRESENPAEYGRAAGEDAPVEVWRDVIVSYPEMREWVAYNKTVPIEILTILAADADPRVRRAVAFKRKLTPDLFQGLANDRDESVRLGIANNPKAPRDLLRKLTSDASEMVRNVALARLAEDADALGDINRG